MTFDRPWMLLAALLPLVWAALAFRRAERRGALAIKAFAFSAVLAALAVPKLSVFETKMSVGVLLDTSASTSDDDLKRASSFARDLLNERGRNTVILMPFAENTREPAQAENGGTRLAHTPGDAGRGTSLEAAIREGIAALPAAHVPKLVLVSDGHENTGSVARAIWQAQELGIPVDTVALEGRPKPELRLESVSVPTQAFTGERFPIDVAVRSPRAAEAVVDVTADGRSLGANPVRLEPGLNSLRVHASVNSSGAVEIAGSLSASGLGQVRFAQAIALRRPRVLFVSGDPPGTEVHLLKALEAAQFQVDRAPAVPPSGLERYQLIVLNNQNLQEMAAARKSAVEAFASQGGGVLVIGGERNVYVEKQRPEDPLERTLPAKIAPPRLPEGTCVVLVLDKSSSMEGRKVELARAAAIGVVENLRPIDMVGVLIFDNSFSWAVPIRRAEEKTLIKRIIAGIMADGGTQIAPALQEAYRRILPQKAAYKHIVLLTDGISEEGDSVPLAREASQRHVTISTVGLGQDVNRTFLEKVALTAGGKSYFLSDPSGLAQILLRDVMEHTGTTAIEKSLRPGIVRQAEILDKVGMDSAPPLLGYVRFTPKPGSEVILTAGRDDPLYVRWQYGLGRAGVFTSDAKSRWAKNWVAWSGFDRFWANVFRDLLPHAQPGEAKLTYEAASDDLEVEYTLGSSVPEPDSVPDVFVFGPHDFRRPVPIRKTAAGVYQGHVHVGGLHGLFRVRPLAESRAFPEIGLLREQTELNEYGSDEALLKQIAEFTGGRFNPDPAQVFDTGGRSVPSTMRLWPALLLLAALLDIAELIARKWRGLIERFRPSRERASAP